MPDSWEQAFWATYEAWAGRLAAFVMARLAGSPRLSAADICHEVWSRFYNDGRQAVQDRGEAAAIFLAASDLIADVQRKLGGGPVHEREPAPDSSDRPLQHYDPAAAAARGEAMDLQTLGKCLKRLAETEPHHARLIHLVLSGKLVADVAKKNNLDLQSCYDLKAEATAMLGQMAVPGDGMTLVSLTIPETPEDRALWLERQLLGPEIGEIAAELQSIHGPANNARSLGEALGPYLHRVLKDGLILLPSAQWNILFTQPHLLLELQEQVFLRGAPYWIEQPMAAEIQKVVQWGRYRLEAAIAMKAPQTPEATAGFADMRIWILQTLAASFLAATLVLAGFGVWRKWLAAPPAPVSARQVGDAGR